MSKDIRDFDLRSFKESLKSFVIDALHDFCAKHPEQLVSVVALYSAPWHGYVELCLDTLANCQATVKDYPQWASRDDRGTFDGYCSNFEFFAYRDWQCEEWKEHYENDGIMRVWLLDGTLEELDTSHGYGGDFEFGRVIFELLVSVMEEVSRSPLPPLQRESTFRIGVHIAESEHRKFWTLDNWLESEVDGNRWAADPIRNFVSSDKLEQLKSQIYREANFSSSVSLGEYYLERPGVRQIGEAKGEAAGILSIPADQYLIIAVNEELEDLASFRSIPDGTVQGLSFAGFKSNWRLADIAHLRSLKWLDLSGCRLGHEDFQILNEFKELRTLRLDATNFSDQDCQYLSDCVALEYLSLGGTQITGAGLKHLKAVALEELHLSRSRFDGYGLHDLPLSRLRVLNLESTKCVDLTFAKCPAFPVLKVLDLGNTPVTDQRFAQLPDTPLLVELDLRRTSISDAAMSRVARMPSLRYLHLAYTRVTDAGLKDLAKLSQSLRSLDLTMTDVTDVGIAYLTDCKELRNLSLFDTDVTAEGTERLVKVLPLCEVSHKSVIEKDLSDLGLDNLRPFSHREASQTVGLGAFLHEHVWYKALQYRKELGVWPELTTKLDQAFRCAEMRPDVAVAYTELLPHIEEWSATLNAKGEGSSNLLASARDFTRSIFEAANTGNPLSVAEAINVLHKIPVTISTEEPADPLLVWVFKLSMHIFWLNGSVNTLTKYIELFEKHIYNLIPKPGAFAAQIIKLYRNEFTDIDFTLADLGRLIQILKYQLDRTPEDGNSIVDPEHLELMSKEMRSVFSQKITRSDIEQEQAAVVHLALDVARLGRAKIPDGLKREFAGLKEKEESDGSKTRVGDLQKVAIDHHLAGNYRDAEHYYRLAMAAFERDPAEKSAKEKIEFAYMLSNFATILAETKRGEEAQTLSTRAMGLYGNILGPSHAGIVSIVANVAWCCLCAGDFKMANQMYVRAWELIGTTEKEKATIAALINNLGEVQRGLGNIGQSEKLLKEALDIRVGALPPDHPHMAYSHANLAKLNRDMGKLEEARKLFQEAIAVHEKQGETIALAITLTEYGSLLRMIGEDKAAKSTDQRAQTIREKMAD